MKCEMSLFYDYYFVNNNKKTLINNVIINIGCALYFIAFRVSGNCWEKQMIEKSIHYRPFGIEKRG